MSRTTIRALATAMATAAIVAGASSCGIPHPGISNGSVTACYRAIPTALTALHSKDAKFVGVHRVTADALSRSLPANKQQLLNNDTEVCAVAFHGTFNPGQVQDANPSAHGDYAVVLVTSRRLNLLASFVLDHLPKRFKGRFV
ncbi:MAG: hypothetical protein ACR2NJ_03670 [Acidimicrobiales bacterium]